MIKRPSARVLLIDGLSRVLLFSFRFPNGRQFWATPGGAVNTGETFEAAARRERLEETGLSPPLFREVFRQNNQFEGPNGEMFDADERFFLAQPQTTQIATSRQEAEEASIMLSHRWWTLAALEQTEEEVFPEDLASRLLPLIAAL